MGMRPVGRRSYERLLGILSLFIFLGAVPPCFGERQLVQLQLDRASIPAGTEVQGSIAIDSGSLTLAPWLLDRGDEIDGGKFFIRLEDDGASGRARGLKTIYRSSLEKGLLLELQAPRGAMLSLETGFGKESVPLARFAPGTNVAMFGGKIRAAALPAANRLTGADGSEEYPSIAVSPDGESFITYISWDGSRDSVMMRKGEEASVIRGPGPDAMDPRCVLDGTGRPRVIWTQSDGEQWDLYAWDNGKIGRLTRNAGNDFWPRAARDASGKTWVAWQSVGDDRHYEVLLARWDGEQLSEAVNVSESGADDWEPSICATPAGRIVVVWDTYRNGSYDVYLREFGVGQGGGAMPLGQPVPVAASAAREAHATVAADPAGRVWVAWEKACENWGKHPGRGASLHSERGIDVACWSGGRLHRPEADLAKSLPDGFRKHSEYPQVAVDGVGRLWVVFRYQNRVAPQILGGRGRAQSYGMWHEFATQLTQDGWGAPILLAHSNGRQDIRAEVANGRDGELLACYATDGRTREFPYKPVDYDLTLVSLAGFGRAASEPRLVEAPDLGGISPAAPDPELGLLTRGWTLGGQDYQLLLGDTHRHTDISRCANGRDGSLQDAYRYALNACGLDWLAISDHDQDILRHRQDRQERPRQLYDWWRSQKYCDLYSIPGRFIALYGYEHGGSYKERGGHKNIIYADRGRPVFEEDSPEQLFSVLANSGAMAIPHQLADGGSRTDWDKWSSQFERVAEIFQARGSYEFEGCPREATIRTEGNMLWDALAKGVRIGIIASSDHGQTHEARAGVYVPAKDGFTRGGILKALYDRRAFGATVQAALQVSVAGRALGEEVETEGAPSVQALVVAPAPIRRLEVVRDGAFVYSIEPNQTRAELLYSDVDLKPGASAYYYVRALIGENDIAWSSPVWVTRKQK